MKPEQFERLLNCIRANGALIGAIVAICHREYEISTILLIVLFFTTILSIKPVGGNK